MQQQVLDLIDRQLDEWKTVSDNYAALSSVRMRGFELNERSEVVLQYNPERKRSSGAKMDAESIKARKCFLCSENQPVEQEAIEWEGRYKIQVNPYPIFPSHLTISALEHTPQEVGRRIDDMLNLAHELNEFVLFYNGPRCGASAPDHMHFQAGNKGFMPLCDEVMDQSLWTPEHILLSSKEGFLGYTEHLGRNLFFIKASERVVASILFARLQLAMLMASGNVDEEPMQNILCWHEGDYCIVVFPRAKHRPDCYGEGEGQFLISPASVDMGGVWAVPVEKDYEAITVELVQAIYDELCLDNAGMARIIEFLLQQD